MKMLIRNLFILTTIALVSACSSTQRAPVYHVTASVISVNKAPELCLPKSYTKKRRLNVAAMIFGGIIGNQFGGGSGKIWTTAGGALLAGYGVPAGRPSFNPNEKLTCKRDGYVAMVTYLHPQTRQMITARKHLVSHTRAEYIVIPVVGEPLPSTNS